MDAIPAERLVAHRGYQRHYPENTLLSVRKAIEIGARFVEIDVLFSADGEPVLYHDSRMRRISGLWKTVHRQSLNELLQYPAHEPRRFKKRFINERIAPLNALVPILQSNPQVTLFIEAKPAGVLRQGVKTAYRKIHKALAPVVKQCVLISYNHPFLQYASEKGFPQIGAVLRSWGDLNTAFMAELNPDYIFCDYADIPAKADLHNRTSGKLVVYEIGSPKKARAWLDRGVDLVETYDIGAMLGKEL